MQDIEYKLIRSRRKTLALAIDAQARLLVRAPLHLGEDAISAFIQQKRRWILRKQQETRENSAKHRPLTLTDGERVPYMGRSYLLRRTNTGEIRFEGEFLCLPQSLTAGDFAIWLKRQAARVIAARLDYYAALMGVRYNSLRMSNARRRWGSCGAGNTLNFSWRLVLCPPAAIDYVVVHELCHIEHKNHGPRFWQAVAAVLPNYRQAKHWLGENRGVADII